MDDFFYLPTSLCKQLFFIGYKPETRFVRDTKNNNSISIRSLLHKNYNKDRFTPAFTLGELQMNDAYFFQKYHGNYYLFKKDYVAIENEILEKSHIWLEANFILKANTEIELRAKAILYHYIEEQIDLYSEMEVQLCVNVTGKSPSVIINNYIYELYKLGAYHSRIDHVLSTYTWWNVSKIEEYIDLDCYYLVEYETEELDNNILVCDSYYHNNFVKHFMTPYGYKIDLDKVNKFTIIPKIK